MVTVSGCADLVSPVIIALQEQGVQDQAFHTWANSYIAAASGMVQANYLSSLGSEFQHLCYRIGHSAPWSQL